VDLETNEVYDDQGFRSGFSVDPFRRKCLLKGLDDIGLTLEHEADITVYESHGIPTPVMHAPVDFKVF
jgi:3-isopropylmalate/(R)-2-methylmalate dehydratase small subunit